MKQEAQRVTQEFRFAAEATVVSRGILHQGLEMAPPLSYSDLVICRLPQMACLL